MAKTDTAETFDLYRSEAFAEDVIDLIAPIWAVAASPDAGPDAVERRGDTGPVLPDAPAPWLVNLMPLGVALLGLAFAVVPPLA